MRQQVWCLLAMAVVAGWLCVCVAGGGPYADAPGSMEHGQGEAGHQHNSLTSQNLDFERERQLYRYSEDPEATQDSFETLTEAQLRDYWSEDTQASLKSKLLSLQNFEVVTFVDVKLVGFNGDGNLKIKLPEAGFERFFKALRLVNTTFVKNGAEDVGDNLPWKHRLSTKMKYMYSVKHAPRTLTNKVNRVLEEYLGKQRRFSVPVEAMDAVLREDFEQSSPLSYTMYILNTARPAGAEGSRPYSYMVTDEVTGAPSKCATTVWAGRERYMWADLSAGPMNYGPQTVGEGIVTEFNVPHVRNYVALSAKKKGERPRMVLRAKSLVADMVTFVSAASNYLVTPALDHFPIAVNEDVHTLRIKLVEISDLDSAQDTKMAALARKRFDFEAIKRELSPLMLAGQEIEFEEQHLSFRECRMCVQALAHALKSHTSTVFINELRTQVHQYIDSVAAEHWLTQLQELFFEDAEEERADVGSGVRVLPVYLFNLKTDDILLLDRFHQARAFENMVVAVQTQSGRTMIDYVCNGRGMAFDTRDATRSVLASILQSAWGVLPTHETWNAASNRSAYNYLWSQGLTPFGPFSTSRKLSFSQRDAAARHVLYSYVNSTLGELGSLLGHFVKFNREIDEVFEYEQHVRFVQRWNVFKFKLQKASLHLSLHGFNNTLYYLKSLQHDIHAMHELVHEGGRNLRSVIRCDAEQRVSWARVFLGAGWVSMVALVLFAVRVFGAQAWGAVVRRRRGKKGKRD